MANTRIKDLPDISPVDDTYVPGDSTGTATGKTTIGAWVLAGIKSALAALSGAVAAAGNWTFSNGFDAQGATFNDEVTFVATTFFNNAVVGDGAHEASSFGDPTAAQSLTTRNYVDTQFQKYTPTYTRGGGGVVAQLGDVVASRCGNMVFLHGVLNFTPGSGGVAETIAITMPSNWPPNNNFSGNGESGGASLLGLHAATDFCTSILGVVGTKTLRWSVTTAGATDLYWWAQYHINN